jgi:hypothetical protein
MRKPAGATGVNSYIPKEKIAYIPISFNTSWRHTAKALQSIAPSSPDSVLFLIRS